MRGRSRDQVTTPPHHPPPPPPRMTTSSCCWLRPRAEVPSLRSSAHARTFPHALALALPEMRHDMAAYTRSGNDIPEKSLDWDSMVRHRISVRYSLLAFRFPLAPNTSRVASRPLAGSPLHRTAGRPTCQGRVEWPDKAKDARYFISKERILEVECGMKVKVGSMRQQRNGIERRNPGDKAYAFVDYSPGYFKTENANPDGPDPGTTTVPDKVGDGINYRPQPSYEQKKAARMKAAEVDGVMSLSVPPGGEDSDDES